MTNSDYFALGCIIIMTMPFILISFVVIYECVEMARD